MTSDDVVSSVKAGWLTVMFLAAILVAFTVVMFGPEILDRQTQKAVDIQNREEQKIHQNTREAAEEYDRDMRRVQKK